MIINQDHPGFSEMQNAKRRFFALRNGVVADALRRNGDTHRIIFGLTLVQLREIASASPHNADFAHALWANESTRCSRLLAPMVMPHDALTRAEGLEMLHSVKTPEEADVLCHSLLKKMPDAIILAQEALASADTDLRKYGALRLFFNLVYMHPQQALSASRKLLGEQSTMVTRLAANLAEESQFVLEG